MAFEGVQAPGQLCAVGLQPLVELTQRLGAQAVEAALGIAADLDEAKVLEAKKAAEAGEFDKATASAKEAEALAKASIFQATSEKTRWRDMEIR